MKEKLKNFIWNDLPLRLSTNLIAIIGIIIVYDVIISMRKDLAYYGYFHWDLFLPGFLFFYGFILLPVIGICLILFLIECIFKKLRLNFLFFKLNFYKCIVLLFCIIAIFPISRCFFY